MHYPRAVSRLIEELTKLPGIGPRSAERLVFHMLKVPASESLQLAAAIGELREKVRYCSTCFNLAEADPCAICSDERRDHRTVCVVERPADVLAVEKSGGFRGVYHVLMGKIAPLDGVGPESLRVKELVERVKRGGISEVIVATSSDVEGEATALYLADILKKHNLKVTRIAHGIPMGSSLDFTDEVTIGRAIEGRTVM